MASLSEILLNNDVRATVIDDCVTLVDEEVSNKSGFSGIAVKGAYGLIKRVKPGVVRESVDRLLEDFATKLDPLYQQHRNEGAQKPLAAFMIDHADDVANALLAITDERAERSESGPLRSAYGKLRPAGVKHVTQAVPGIARIIAKYAK